MNGEINAILFTPAMCERLLAAECVGEQTSTTEFAGLIAAESASMARSIRDAQIKAE